MKQRFIGTPEAAKILGMDQSRIRQLALTGELRGQKLGEGEKASWMFLEKDVLALRDSDRRGPGRPPKEARG